MPGRTGRAWCVLAGAALLAALSTSAGGQQTGHTAAASAPAARVRADFHVAPAGSDTNPGTKDKPFATLARARQAVRGRIAAGLDADVTVLVHGGRYELTAPLVFGPADSGTPQHAITYAAVAGEKPILSGGRRVGGWKKSDGGTWTAVLPPSRKGEPVFRNLWVNGRRATRARSPNADAETPKVRLQAVSLSKDLKTFTVQLAPGQVKAWRNPGDIEMLIDGNWAINRKRVGSLDATTGTLIMAPPHRKTIPWNQPRKGRWAWLENSPDFLDRPGEWCLDRKTRTVTYRPLDGEDMTKAEAVAPVLTRLVELKGTADRPIRNVHFVGLTFAHTDWRIPPVGYFGVQACHHVAGRDAAGVRGRIPCAIRWDHVRDCSFRDGAIAHLGGGGIELVDGCVKGTIEGNRIFDISANGVMLGGPKDEGLVPKDCRVANNDVHAVGVEYHGAVGIWVGFAQRAAIVHNRVHDTPYTGISVGWQWNPQPTPCKANLIASNHIFDVMKRLGDGGGIYTLGFQPGTVLRGNYIHDVRRSRFNQAAPNNGMFIDEGSKGFLFERNVIRATAGRPVRHNQNRPEWHTWKGNHFDADAPLPAAGRIGQALRGAVEVPHRADLEPEHLTLSAWVRLGQFPAGKDPRRWIAGKNANEWAEGHYALVIAGNKAGAYLNIGGGRENEHHAWADKDLLKLDTWHHVAMTYDGRDLKVYLDGRQVASRAVGKKRVPGRQPFAIGRRPDRYVAFAGLIDDVRLYARVLSAAEVQAQAARPAALADPKAEKALAGYWSFDDLAEGRKDVREIIAQAGPEPSAATARSRTTTTSAPATGSAPAASRPTMSRAELIRRVRELNAETIALFREKKYAAAEAKCRQGMHLLPADATFPYNLACALARQGKADGALAALTRSVELGYDQPAHMKADEDLAALRADKRFADLAKRAEANRLAHRPRYEPPEKMPDLRTVEGNPKDGLRWRVRMSPKATKGKPNRLVVWLHPSGGSMNRYVEPMARGFVRRGFALCVLTQKQFRGWTSGEGEQLLSVTLPDVAKVAGIDARRPILMGYSAGGQLALRLYAQDPGRFGGLVLDAAYPIRPGSGVRHVVTSPPNAPAVKTVPIFVVVGDRDGGARAWRIAQKRWPVAGVPLVVHYVPGKGHTWLFDKARTDELHRWLEQVAAGKLPAVPTPATAAAPASVPATKPADRP